MRMLRDYFRDHWLRKAQVVSSTGSLNPRGAWDSWMTSGRKD